MNAALPFSVSVQWGRGHHYFVGHFVTEKEANSCAEYEFSRLTRRTGKRGAKPRVLVWELQRVLPPIPAEELLASAGLNAPHQLSK